MDDSDERQLLGFLEKATWKTYVAEGAAAVFSLAVLVVAGAIVTSVVLDSDEADQPASASATVDNALAPDGKTADDAVRSTTTTEQVDQGTFWDLLLADLATLQEGESYASVYGEATVTSPLGLSFSQSSSWDCSMVNTIDKGVFFGSVFDDGHALVSLNDNAAGTVSGGIAAGGEEWEFARPGSLDLKAAVFFVPVYKDRVVKGLDEEIVGRNDLVIPSRRDIDPDGNGTVDLLLPKPLAVAKGLVIQTHWVGATTENFSGAKAEASIDVACVFLPGWLIELVGPGYAEIAMFERFNGGLARLPNTTTTVP